MPEKPRVWTLMDSGHVKGSETLQKSPRQYFRHVCSKKSILVVSEILRPFIHMLTPNDKYSLSVKASV